MLLDTKKTLQTASLQRNFQWEFLLPDGISDQVKGTDISPYIQSVKFGGYNSSDLLTLRYGPYQSFAAGVQSINKISISILSPSNGHVVQYFHDWRSKIIAPGGYYFNKAHYVRSTYCYLYDRKGDETLSYKLINIFPTLFPSYDLSYKGEEFVTFNIEFSVDEVIPTQFSQL